MRRILTLLATVITLGVGLVVILDLTIGGSVIAPAFLRWTTVTLAIMILAGLINLLIVHGGRIVKRERSWPYSLVLLVAAGGVIGFWLFGRTDWNTLLLNSVQVSIESSLAALMFFALVYGAYRLLHRKLTWWSSLFILSVIIVLVGALPLSYGDGFTAFYTWMIEIPIGAGARGILFGIALGAVVTGVRVLLGQDRSYRE